MNYFEKLNVVHFHYLSSDIHLVQLKITETRDKRQETRDRVSVCVCVQTDKGEGIGQQEIKVSKRRF